jgi:hypothetical protein
LTPDGQKPIEEFRAGDLILSRAEHDPNGRVEVKTVLETFVRQARVMDLRVNDRTIRSTMEHPFFVRGKGWIRAHEIRLSDELSTHDGKWVSVQWIGAVPGSITVYNISVEDYRTYFVGHEAWGFSVWVHNANYVAVRGPDNQIHLYYEGGGLVRHANTREVIRSFGSMQDLAAFLRTSPNFWPFNFRGGSYAAVRAGNTGGDVHHTPATAALTSSSSLSREEGPAIFMSTPDHARTASFAGNPGYRAHIDRQRELISQGRWRDAIQMDIDDIRRLFPDGRYDEGIRQMLEYARRRGLITGS